MRGFLLVVMLTVLGCAFQLPASRTVTSLGPDGAVTESVEPAQYSPLCLEAVRERNAWGATSTIFNSLATATSGAVVTSEFLTDEEWVPAAFSIGGLVFGGIGIGAGLVADDLDSDVLFFCGQPVGE